MKTREFYKDLFVYLKDSDKCLNITYTLSPDKMIFGATIFSYDGLLSRFTLGCKVIGISEEDSLKRHLVLWFNDKNPIIKIKEVNKILFDFYEEKLSKKEIENI